MVSTTIWPKESAHWKMFHWWPASMIRHFWQLQKLPYLKQITSAKSILIYVLLKSRLAFLGWNILPESRNSPSLLLTKRLQLGVVAILAVTSRNLSGKLQPNNRPTGGVASLKSEAFGWFLQKLPEGQAVKRFQEQSSTKNTAGNLERLLLRTFCGNKIWAWAGMILCKKRKSQWSARCTIPFVCGSLLRLFDDVRRIEEQLAYSSNPMFCTWWGGWVLQSFLNSSKGQSRPDLIAGCPWIYLHSKFLKMPLKKMETLLGNSLF